MAVGGLGGFLDGAFQRESGGLLVEAGGLEVRCAVSFDDVLGEPRGDVDGDGLLFADVCVGEDALIAGAGVLDGHAWGVDIGADGLFDRGAGGFVITAREGAGEEN